MQNHFYIKKKQHSIFLDSEIAEKAKTYREMFANDELSCCCLDDVSLLAFLTSIRERKHQRFSIMSCAFSIYLKDQGASNGPSPLLTPDGGTG